MTEEKQPDTVPARMATELDAQNVSGHLVAIEYALGKLFTMIALMVPHTERAEHSRQVRQLLTDTVDSLHFQSSTPNEGELLAAMKRGAYCSIDRMLPSLDEVTHSVR
jgi:hypothetical protein